MIVLNIIKINVGRLTYCTVGETIQQTDLDAADVDIIGYCVACSEVKCMALLR